MVDINPIRGAYISCSNEIRRLVIHASTVNHQSNTQLALTFRISKRTVQRFLLKFHSTAITDKLPRGGNKPFK